MGTLAQFIGAAVMVAGGFALIGGLSWLGLEMFARFIMGVGVVADALQYREGLTRKKLQEPRVITKKPCPCPHPPARSRSDGRA